VLFLTVAKLELFMTTHISTAVARILREI